MEEGGLLRAQTPSPAAGFSIQQKMPHSPLFHFPDNPSIRSSQAKKVLFFNTLCRKS